MGAAKAREARIRRWIERLEAGGMIVAGFERGSRGHDEALTSLVNQYSDRELEDMFPAPHSAAKT